MNKLPEGYTLERDADGDWILWPPVNVTIFSVPGEGYLIGRCSEGEAIAEALSYLECLADEA